MKEENHHNPGSTLVYHGHSRRAVRLAALCMDGLPEQHYQPEAIDDDIALVWCLVMRREVVCYAGDPDTGTHHCVLPTIEEARDHFAALYGCDLRIIWL